MSDKWLGRIVTFIYGGVPAVLIYLSFIYGSISEAFNHWFSAADRAEQRELYPIIGDKEVSKVATKYISGSMECFDNFNDKNLPMEFEMVWVRVRDKIGEIPLRDSMHLFSGRHQLNTNGFSKEVPPDTCRVESGELQEAVANDSIRNLTATCERSAEIGQLLSQVISGRFWVSGEEGILLESVEQQYEIICQAKVSERSDCLPRDYGSRVGISVKHEWDFGEFTEYNYCDNSENAEFKKQVLDKWSREK